MLLELLLLLPYIFFAQSNSGYGSVAGNGYLVKQILKSLRPHPDADYFCLVKLQAKKKGQEILGEVGGVFLPLLVISSVFFKCVVYGHNHLGIGRQ